MNDSSLKVTTLIFVAIVVVWVCPLINVTLTLTSNLFCEFLETVIFEEEIQSLFGTILDLLLN